MHPSEFEALLSAADRERVAAARQLRDKLSKVKALVGLQALAAGSPPADFDVTELAQRGGRLALGQFTLPAIGQGVFGAPKGGFGLAVRDARSHGDSSPSSCFNALQGFPNFLTRVTRWSSTSSGSRTQATS